MAQLILTIPDEQVDRVRAAFARRRALDISEVTANSIRSEMIDILKDIVRTEEAHAAEEAARLAVTDVDVT